MRPLQARTLVPVFGLDLELLRRGAKKRAQLDNSVLPYLSISAQNTYGRASRRGDLARVFQPLK